MKYLWSKGGILSVLLVIAAFLAVYDSSPSIREAGSDINGHGLVPPPHPSGLDRRMTQRPDKPRQERRPEGGNISFEELKRQWMALRSINPSIGMSDEDITERENLAIESLRSLKLSAGAFELDAFLIENEIPINRNGAGLLAFHRKILEVDPAFWGDLRVSLVLTLHDLGNKVSAASPYGSVVGLLADSGSDSDFEELYQDLKGHQPELAKKALLVRGGYQVERSPEQLAGVMESTLERLREVGGLQTLDSHTLVNLVHRGNSAEQFEKTLEVLNKFSARHAEVKLSLLKSTVLENWARTDPIHVADVVLSDSSLDSDELIGSIASTGWHVVERERGMEGLAQWLSSIPSEPAKRNAINGVALSMSASYLEGGTAPEHVKSLEKALQISNLLPPDEREKVFGAGSPLTRDFASGGKK
jgi:hypothetical protein